MERTKKDNFSDPIIHKISEGGESLEDAEKVTEKDIKLLKDRGILGDDFIPDDNYLPISFIKEAVKIIEEKYPKVAEDIPISVVDASNSKTPNIEAGKAPKLILWRGKSHTKLLVETEKNVFIMDSHANNKDPELEKAFSSQIILYPTTPEYMEVLEKSSEIQKLIDSANEKGDFEAVINLTNKISYYQPGLLGIQKDGSNCISFSLMFAEEMCRNIQKEKEENKNLSIKECLDNILKTHCPKNTNEAKLQELGENRDMFTMPIFFIKFGQSEVAIDKFITEYTKNSEEFSKENEKEELEKELKKFLVPYKEKIKEELTKRTKELAEKLEKTEISAKQLQEKKEKISTELRNQYSFAKNKRKEDFVAVAGKIRDEIVKHGADGQKKNSDSPGLNVLSSCKAVENSTSTDEISSSSNNHSNKIEISNPSKGVSLK